MEKDHFRIDINREEHKIYISLNSIKYSDYEVHVIIKELDTNKEIFNQNMILDNNELSYWFRPSGDINDYFGFVVKIYNQSNEEIFEETTRFRGRYGDKIKKQCLFIADIGGMGDQYSAEPLIRKISKSFEQKIIVFSYYPQLFVNHPCIDKLVVVHHHHALGEISKNVPEEYLNKDLYEIRYIMRWERDSFGYIPHWSNLDFKQFAAFQYGISLKNDELDFHFYPDDYKPIEELPEKYVVINPSKTGADRTWSVENWQKLIDILNDNDINVVAIGKETTAKSKDTNDTVFYDINIKKGINLCGDERQNDLSQVWHILNNAQMFITLDTGLFIFAGSTDTFILQIGSVGNPDFHIPYRKGGQTYKYKHVDGECILRCISDPKYTIQHFGFFGDKKGGDRLGSCFMRYSEYKCHPKPDVVGEEALKILLT